MSGINLDDLRLNRLVVFDLLTVRTVHDLKRHYTHIADRIRHDRRELLFKLANLPGADEDPVAAAIQRAYEALTEAENAALKRAASEPEAEPL
jgi:hypothetical protein